MYKEGYTITYNLNGGTGNVPAAQVVPANKVFMPAIAGGFPMNTGKYFVGWADTKDAKEPMTKVFAKGDMASLFGVVSEVVSSSKDISVFWKELISVTRDMLVSKYTESPKDYLDLTEQETQQLLEAAKLFNLSSLVYHCKVLDDAAARMLRDPATKRTTAEFALLRMCRPELDTSNDALSARIAKLEDAVALGVPVAASPAPAVEKTEAKPVAEAPAPAPAAPPAPIEAKPAPKAAPVMGEGEYERVRDISEAVGRLDGTNRGLASFLMSSEAYVSRDGKKLLLRVEGFAAMMFKSEDSKNAVANAFALARITDGVAHVTVETIKAGEKKQTASDDLSGWL